MSIRLCRTSDPCHPRLNIPNYSLFSIYLNESSSANMLQNYYKGLLEPRRPLYQALIDKPITTNGVSAYFALFLLIRDAVHIQNVDDHHVANFIKLTSRFRPGFKPMFAIRHVLFESIIRNMKFGTDVILSVFDPIPRLLQLVVAAGVPQDLLPLGDVQPFTRHDLIDGLIEIYWSPGISATVPTPILANFRFHIFASTLYHSGAVREPVFFVRAMSDALEMRWNDPGSLLLALYPVHWWVMHFGYQLFKQNTIKDWMYPNLLRHGSLYNMELIREFGKQRPRPGLTTHRWQFWKRRLEETMVDVVNVESNYVLSGPQNIAWQAAEKISQILLKEVGEV
ncbi:hypothetical protein F4781DRAFT_83314 [Annulohypoxylon bovei var. microspora]|nr:hypothetical protein F4781DRAFT_83314 [Annulohypoxylon bovei var. microspora]